MPLLPAVLSCFGCVVLRCVMLCSVVICRSRCVALCCVALRCVVLLRCVRLFRCVGLCIVCCVVVCCGKVLSNNPCYVLLTAGHNPTNYTTCLTPRPTQPTSLAARQHLESSTQLDQRNSSLIYQVDQPKYPHSLPDNISTARRNSTNTTAGLFFISTARRNSTNTTAGLFIK